MALEEKRPYDYLLTMAPVDGALTALEEHWCQSQKTVESNFQRGQVKRHNCVRFQLLMPKIKFETIII